MLHSGRLQSLASAIYFAFSFLRLRTTACFRPIQLISFSTNFWTFLRHRERKHEDFADKISPLHRGILRELPCGRMGFLLQKAIPVCPAEQGNPGPQARLPPWALHVPRLRVILIEERRGSNKTLGMNVRGLKEFLTSTGLVTLPARDGSWSFVRSIEPHCTAKQITP
jgi:hypothetical protein